MEIFCIEEGKVEQVSDFQIGKDCFSVVTYETIKENEKFMVSDSVLKEARRFGYAKYDVFEHYDCVSLELLNLDHLLVSKGSVILYIEKNKCLFCTAQQELVSDMVQRIMEILGERISLNRLIYAFFESQIKNNHEVADLIEKEIMELEQDLMTSKNKNCVWEIIRLRKELMILKRYYEQLLNVFDIFLQNENDFFDDLTLRSFKMLSRQVNRRFQNVLNLREYLTQLREAYEAEVEINLNTTMKFFTVVTTIFLPLTLIAGWYGMNLQMPEYEWEYSYYVVIGVCILIVLGCIYFFKKKNWF